MYIGLHVKYRYSCSILMKLEFSRQILEKSECFEAEMAIKKLKAHTHTYTGHQILIKSQQD